jgi:hypothetical protein
LQNIYTKKCNVYIAFLILENVERGTNAASFDIETVDGMPEDYETCDFDGLLFSQTNRGG